MTSTFDVLPEQNSVTAARILTAANDLLLARGAKGFTVADVATRAHVGKGTVYLYWPTKEDLLIGLVGRGFLRILEELIARFGSDADLARPSHFCPTMLQVATGQPLIAALQRHDDDLLGILADHPRSIALTEALGPDAVLHAALPLWREHGMARTDWDIADQTFAVQALISGVLLSVLADPVATDHRLNILGTAVTALLGPERTTQNGRRAAAQGIIDFLRNGQAAALHVIGSPS
ncbi:TetR/AcrR family transcriptional regulator [Mycobacterium sp. ITM-2017-0098]|nr:TetR/AcrR family transcriptional regulator [Mycobacterium sp. ITM-2017-0098]